MSAAELFTTVGEADTPKDFRRDQWGRPSIMQPDGKRKGYTRCSSAAKTIEDTFNLERYKRRNTVYGMAYDSSLVARLIAIGGAPDVWGKAEKDQVNAIVDAADAVAQAHKRADIGTAVHHLTHRVDRGETVNAGPYQADIDAYRAQFIAYGLEIDPRFIECRMVNDELEMAGTADRIVKSVTHHGRTTAVHYKIADIKTGATIDFGGLGWSAQLAAYAGGQLYDVDLEQRIETPFIDTITGLIIHLPAGEGRCDIYEVDIAQGLVAARLANDIRAVRKASKKWIVPVARLAAPPVAMGEQAPTGTESLSSVPVDEHKNSGESQPAVEADSPDQVAGSATDEATTSSVAGITGRTQSGPQSTPPSVDAVATDRRTELQRRFWLLNEHDQAKFRGLFIDPNDLDLIETHLNGLDVFMHVADKVLAIRQLIDTSNVPAQRPKVVPIPEPSLGEAVEGPTVTDGEWSNTARAFDQLDAAGKTFAKDIVAEAHAAQQWMSGIGNKTTRRLHLLRGLVRLAEAEMKGEL